MAGALPQVSVPALIAQRGDSRSACLRGPQARLGSALGGHWNITERRRTWRKTSIFHSQVAVAVLTGLDDGASVRSLHGEGKRQARRRSPAAERMIATEEA
ncbi:hypothetical protein ORS3428_03830 [Mesorhizobium sp. ORS 3428]|nr:hypothetical protein ORS3428_03830 [Mesorhizobium sp. ORS 3428]